MEITIKGDAKEIAALVLAVQERRENVSVDRLIHEIVSSAQKAVCDTPVSTS